MGFVRVQLEGGTNELANDYGRFVFETWTERTNTTNNGSIPERLCNDKSRVNYLELNDKLQRRATEWIECLCAITERADTTSNSFVSKRRFRQTTRQELNERERRWIIITRSSSLIIIPRYYFLHRPTTIDPSERDTNFALILLTKKSEYTVQHCFANSKNWVALTSAPTREFRRTNCHVCNCMWKQLLTSMRPCNRNTKEVSSKKNRQYHIRVRPEQQGYENEERWS